MQKIKIIVDSPSDIPNEDLQRYQIEMVKVPMVIDGKEYVERESFQMTEFYSILQQASEIPVTSRIPIGEYIRLYREAWENGCTDVVNITINAGGSGIYESASMAVEQFFSIHPEAKGKMNVHMVDSRSYSMGYGYPVVQAAIMAQQGQTAQQIVQYLRDFFDRIEIYLACYTLDFAKKSGRITAAAAFVGDVLGLRPIISMIDGQTKTVEKVRGDKQVVHRLLDVYRKRRDPADSLVYTISAAIDEYGNELQALLEKETGRPVPQYKAGAAITVNAGPNIVALCVLGKKRGAK